VPGRDARYDVAVVGAGPAGSATARRLARLGCRVVLLERTRFETLRVGESLAPASQALLIELGVWSQFMAISPLASFGTRSLWGSAEALDHSHLMTPYGCGWHVDRGAFDRMLAQSAVAANAELWLGARVMRCMPTGDGGWALQVVRTDAPSSQPPCELHAAVVVDAAGRGSCLARWFGARRAVFDRLVGAAARFAHSGAANEGYTLVEAGIDGWWYSAPYARDRMVAMLMTDGDLAMQADLRTRDGWWQALQRAHVTYQRMKSGEPLRQPQMVSAISQRLIRSELSAPWIAVGDAALSVDPISGSGVIRALKTAEAGARAVLAVLDGDKHAIAEYESERHDECTRYLQERAAYYGFERRWERSEFWRRREPTYASELVARE
jgi:flavin-dependent dehydrogenase